MMQNLVKNSVLLIYEEGFRHFVPTSLDARRWGPCKLKGQGYHSKHIPHSQGFAQSLRWKGFAPDGRTSLNARRGALAS